MRRKRKLPMGYIEYLKNQGLSLSEIKNRLYYEFNIDVSKATIMRRLRK